jgi:ADP-heptose:LPS heptosyltransferase
VIAEVCMSGEEKVDSIVVFRALKLGDMLCSVPALRAIRSRYRDARVTLIGLPQLECFVKKFSHYVDEFLSFPGFPGFPEQDCDVREFPEFLRRIQERKFDLAIQLHGSGELSNPLVKLFGARRTIGTCLKESSAESAHFLPAVNDHEVKRCLSLLPLLGITETSDVLEYPITDHDRERARKLKLPASYVCVHPGASDEGKRWSAEGFAEIADELSLRGYNVVFTGNKRESDLVQKILRLMKRGAWEVAALDLELGVLAAVIEKSMGLVCNDTGVSHLAAALKKKSIVLFSATDPKRWAPLDQKLHLSLFRPTSHEVLRAIDQQFAFMEEEVL